MIKRKIKEIKGISTRHKPFVRIEDTTTGITLVALVVTIVVLLILAGITVNMLFGKDGIIKKAQEASDATRAGAVQDAVNFWKGEKMIDKRLNQSEKTLDQLLDELVQNKLLTEPEKKEVQISEGLKIGNRFIDFGDDSTFRVELIPNYLNDISLLLVYTDQEDTAYVVNEKVLCDLSESGYKYNEKAYSKVYGMVFSTNDLLTLKKSDVNEMSKLEVEMPEFTYGRNFRGYYMDVNEDNACNGNDANYVDSYLRNSDNTENLGSNWARYIKSDVDKNKIVNEADSDLISGRFNLPVV